ncbi:MAG TPA: CapA family protein [Pyrinomonadaceae bacterium]|nr:CapA family protein [Pyrinomonadaceae bacterium]
MFPIRAIPVFFLTLAAVLAACGGQTVIPQSPFVEQRPSATPGPMREAVTVAAVGDIMLGSPFPNDTRMPPNDGADLLKEFTPLISAADIAFGNLEGPMVDGGTSTKCREPRPGQPIRCFAFRMPTRYGKYLKEAGFDVLSLANNHALDFGAAGSLSTRQTLDALGIKHAGSDKEKFSTVHFEAKGFKVAVVAFAHNAVVPNVNDLEGARTLVARAAREADIVIVSFHGGAEGTDHQNVPRATEIYVGEKRGNLPLFARTVIDAGADLVLGHGPHVLRGIEIYKDRLIAYSLGNFATYGWFRLEAETALTMLLEVKLAADGRFIEGKIHSGRQEGRGIPVLDETGAALKKVKDLSAADFPGTSPRFEPDGRILPR